MSVRLTSGREYLIARPKHSPVSVEGLLLADNNTPPLPACEGAVVVFPYANTEVMVPWESDEYDEIVEGR